MTREAAGMLTTFMAAIVISDAAAAILVFSVGIAIGVLVILGADAYTRRRH